MLLLNFLLPVMIPVLPIFITVLFFIVVVVFMHYFERLALMGKTEEWVDDLTGLRLT